MNKPLISVVIATYKRKDALREALTSLACQTYSNIEAILVDDNANEEWNNLVNKEVEAFKKGNPKFALRYIVNRENKGSAETRNIGIRQAKGEYITFLDDDDVYLPEKIEHQIEKMLETEADYSITDLFLYDEKDKLIDKRIRSYIEKTDKNFLLKYHLMHHITGTDTMMFKKDYLTKIGGFPPIDVGDEFYLMREAIMAGGKFVYIPGCFVKAYVHTGEGGLSSGEGKIKGENALFEFKKTQFDLIDKKSVRFIKMRHYAVLAFAEIRLRHYIKFFGYSICSFITSPIDCIKLFLGDGR